MVVGLFVVVVLATKLTFVIEPLGASTLILRGPNSDNLDAGRLFVTLLQPLLVLAVGFVCTRVVDGSGVVGEGGVVRVEGGDTVGAG